MKKLSISSKRAVNGGLSHCTKVALGGAASGAASGAMSGAAAGAFGVVGAGAIGAIGGAAGSSVADTKCDGIKHT